MGRPPGNGAPNVPQRYVDEGWDLWETLIFDRVAQGVPQTDIMAAVGVSATGMQRWEHGELLPPLPVLIGIADQLGWKLVLIPEETP